MKSIYQVSYLIRYSKMQGKNIKTNKYNKGYTLLFSILVAVIVLAIAASILSISRKEFILTTTARDSLSAIYAADSLAECVLSNNIDTSVNPLTITCGTTVPQTLKIQWSNNAGTYTGTLTDDSGVYMPEVGNGCAILDITSQTVNGQVKTIVRTYGHSLGYTAQDCKSPTNPKVIERGLQLTL